MLAAPLFKALAVLAALVIGAVVIYYAVIFDSPLPDHPILRGKNDLALHFAAFFALSTPVLMLGQWYKTLTGLVLFAGLIEIVQAFQTRRNADWADFAGGVAGIAMGVIVVLVLCGIKSLATSDEEQLNE